MELQLEELKRKKIIEIPDEDVRAFSEKVIISIRNKIIDTLNDVEVNNENIEEYLVASIFDAVENLKDTKKQLFTCPEYNGEIIWQVIYTNDVVTLDSYIIDIATKNIKPHTTLELALSPDNLCELSFKIKDDSLKDNEELEQTLALNRLSMLLRLCFYIFTLKSKTI